MSGHSHFSSIKHKKAITDAKRGKIFSKLARMISVAAREKGGDIETNPTLRMAVEQAKAANMPQDNVERAIKKGTGELTGEQLESVTFEAYGPGGTAIIIEGITDNRNRTLGEIKQILNLHKGKLAGGGSVRWIFERKGVLILDPASQETETKESLELILIEAGAEDIKEKDEVLEVYTKPEELEKVRAALEEKGLKTESASLDWVPKEEISLSEQEKAAALKLFEALDESDAVQEIYSNIKLP